MSYRVRYTLPDGRTGHWMRDYPTREEARKAIGDRQGACGAAYYVEEVVSTAAVPDATPDQTASQQGPAQPVPSKPPIGVMPRRVWEEQRIRELAKAIGRAMEHSAVCATTFHAGNVRDWAAEIVDLCERMEGGL